jgi:uncharacterized protein YbcC (UPF0753/DUF2309 family)
MNQSATLTDHTVDAEAELKSEKASRLEHLQHSIGHAAHILPSQGPIEVFVHHNTLHAFEELHFHDAVKKGKRVYGASPYLREKTFRDMLETGRMTLEDLEHVAREDLGSDQDRQIAGLDSRADLRMAMLRYRFDVGSDAELRWLVAETDALEKFREEVPFRIREEMIRGAQRWLESASENGHSNDVRKFVSEECGAPSSRWREKEWEAFVLRFLWRVCRNGVEGLAPRESHRPDMIRPRDILQHATGEDIDQYVNEFLIRFVSAFLDQGYADWSLPHRDDGLYRAFVEIYRHRKSPPDRWMRGLKRELIALHESLVGPEQSILDSLELLGIEEAHQDKFITQTLLALGGWAGMIWQMESAADWTVRPAPKGSLMEYLAIRLVLEHQAILYVGEQRLGCDNSAREVIELARKQIQPRETMSVDRRAFHVFQLAQVRGWHPEQLVELTPQDWQELVEEVESLSGIDRRRLFQDAYERQYRVKALDAFAIQAARRRELAAERAARNAKSSKPARHSFQIVCCIDDREESFRRHLEEIDPEVETFGAAGFFAAVIYYRGATDAYYKPLCPAIITPDHYVTENVGYTFEGINQQRATSRQHIGRVTHRLHAGSRTFFGGIFTGLLGSLATIPLVARVLFPWLTSKIRARFGRLLQPPPVTQLQLERYQEPPGDSNGHIGFTVEEMADIVERLLQDIGLTKTEDFSRLFVVCGHGAASLNNPHESAYCCGACAGKRGGPNARTFAQMANDWRVRALLDERGLKIPNDTVFIGAYHDTTNDSVVWYDLDRMPASHHTDFEHAQTICEEARTRNAHERCRRFASASLDLDNRGALRHVETRGQDLSEVRPEYNHATNSLCVVGRRDWSRGLFLDRRAFLTSYDPAQDDEESSILLRILAAAIPVCAGINLEYYFSTVDNRRYGSGSKLPHNLASMLGVMEGANSDLRTGLYQQMIEIHEPMRLLFVIETSEAAMRSIMDRDEGIDRLCRGEWVQLALIDPQTSEILWWHNGEFVPYEPSRHEIPTVESSREWYEKKRNHLGFVTILEKNVSES